jgi:hypothetical protein
VLIFPEGTRVPYGTVRKVLAQWFSALAVNAELAGAANCSQRRQVLAESRLGQEAGVIDRGHR